MTSTAHKDVSNTIQPFQVTEVTLVNCSESVSVQSKNYLVMVLHFSVLLCDPEAFLRYVTIVAFRFYLLTYLLCAGNKKTVIIETIVRAGYITDIVGG